VNSHQEVRSAYLTYNRLGVLHNGRNLPTLPTTGYLQPVTACSNLQIRKIQSYNNIAAYSVVVATAKSKFYEKTQTMDSSHNGANDGQPRRWTGADDGQAQTMDMGRPLQTVSLLDESPRLPLQVLGNPDMESPSPSRVVAFSLGEDCIPLG
jgi:hypothetical protein